jgi:integrase
MTDLSRVRVAGPLEPFAAGFAGELVGQGYASQPAAQQLRLLAHVSRWLAAEGKEVAALDAEAVEAFVISRRAAGYSNHLTGEALRPLLGYLRRLGAVPGRGVLVPGGPVDVALERYRRYLMVERGLSVITVRVYVDAVRPFLAGRVLPDGRCLDLQDLEAAQVTAFVVARCRAQSRAAAKQTTTALRSLLVYLHVEGEIARPLAAAVPSVAGWRLAGLPKGLEPEEVRALLASCDRGIANGRRDFAILTTLVRLGVRHRLARRGDHRPWQGQPLRATAIARRRRRGDLGLPARPRSRRYAGARAVCPCEGPAGLVDEQRGQQRRGRCCPTGRPGDGRRAPPTPHRRHADAARRRVAAGDRPGVASSPHVDDGDLRQDRP